MAATAVLCLLLALFRRRAPQARALWAPLFVVLVLSSVAALLALRGRGVPPLLDARPIDAAFDRARPDASGRVTVIAIDAGSLDLITSATAGRSAAELRENPRRRRRAPSGDAAPDVGRGGVGRGGDREAAAEERRPLVGHLSARRRRRALQLLPDYCFAHGLERFGFLVEQAHTSATFRTRTLWSILSTDGFSVGVVGWPLTQPAPVVRGYVVSDTYHRVALTASGIDDPSAIYPPELQVDALAAMESAIADSSPVVTASMVRDHAGRDVDRHRGSILRAKCGTCGC